MTNPNIRVLREDPNRSWIGSLRYSLDVFDARDNLILSRSGM